MAQTQKWASGFQFQSCSSPCKIFWFNKGSAARRYKITQPNFCNGLNSFFMDSSRFINKHGIWTELTFQRPERLNGVSCNRPRHILHISEKNTPQNPYIESIYLALSSVRQTYSYTHILKIFWKKNKTKNPHMKEIWKITTHQKLNPQVAIPYL